MLFTSGIAAKTWDAMVYHHDGVYYLYYLISEHFVCDGFAVATSHDGVHWQDHGWVLRHSDDMVRYLGSGSVWQDARSANAERFICNYSEWRLSDAGKNVQSIFFASSEDLLRWRKLGDDAAFKIDERFYKRIEPDALGPWQDPRWDGMCVIRRPEGGYYGYWTATPKDFLGFGFGESADGLHWQALEPPRIEWGDTPKMYFIEVGGVHEIEGTYYAMLADYATAHCGMFGFVSDTPSGPFRPVTKNLSLLANQSRMHAYFTRFVDSPDGVLVIHHSLAEGQFSDERYTVYYAPFKKAQIIDGALYLAWWRGNESLKRREVTADPSSAGVRFEADQGIVLEGDMILPGKLAIHNDSGTATGVIVDHKGVTEIGPINMDWSGFICEERVDRELPFGPRARFRLLLNRTMLEFYLNDILIQCYTMTKPTSGAISFQNPCDVKLWQW